MLCRSSSRRLAARSRSLSPDRRADTMIASNPSGLVTSRGSSVRGVVWVIGLPSYPRAVHSRNRGWGDKITDVKTHKGRARRGLRPLEIFFCGMVQSGRGQGNTLTGVAGQQTGESQRVAAQPPRAECYPALNHAQNNIMGVSFFQVL